MTALFEHRGVPQERVIVTDAAACWVGVDPSTRGLAVAAILADGQRRTAWRPLAGLRGAERLAFAYRAAVDLGRRIAAEWAPPGVVLIEEPLRQAQDMTSQQLVGVVQAGLFEGTGGAAVRADVTSSRWKLLATGYGGHRKPSPKDRRAGAVYGVAVWAAGAPWSYAGDSWDVADACGIAEAAWRLFDLVPSA